MRDKYANKSTAGKIFHKYTGIITIGIIIPIVAISWAIYDDSTVFFENWSCLMIYEMKVEGLTNEELLRHAEIVQECKDRPIQYQTEMIQPDIP